MAENGVGGFFEKPAGKITYGGAVTGAGMMPGGGVMDALGYAVDFHGNPLPSFGENILRGNYLDAGLQGLATAGDVAMVLAPFTFGTSALLGTGLKGPRAAQKIAKSNKGLGEVLMSENMQKSFDFSGKAVKETLGSKSIVEGPDKKKRLLILSCGGKKCSDIEAVQALERYTGPMFQQVKKAIREKYMPEDLDIAILSAEHGLISPKLPIKNYDTIMTPDRAKKLLSDPDQVNRIKNSTLGYEEVIVQGSPKYSSVIEKATEGAKNIKKIEGSYLNMRGQLGKFLRGEE